MVLLSPSLAVDEDLVSFFLPRVTIKQATPAVNAKHSAAIVGNIIHNRDVCPLWLLDSEELILEMSWTGTAALCLRKRKMEGLSLRAVKGSSSPSKSPPFNTPTACKETKIFKPSQTSVNFALLEYWIH